MTKRTWLSHSWDR